MLSLEQEAQLLLGKADRTGCHLAAFTTLTRNGLEGHPRWLIQWFSCNLFPPYTARKLGTSKKIVEN